MRYEPPSATALDRRGFLRAAAGTATAAGIAGSVAWPSRSAAAARRGHSTAPAPKPIPGGLLFPDQPLIHVFAPGDPAVTLPFTGTVLQGFDVEPSTILDFSGFSAVAYHVGTATGSDGRTYNLETDMRAFQGDYVDAAGTRRHGTFGFV
jgi:hypothetical protein